MPKISFRNVKKVYPSGTYALNDINFDVDAGDFICIIGESGGGKTTLLKLIAGLDIATAGEIYFDGEINNYVKAAKRNVAFVFQEYTIYPTMTVFENIMFSLNKEKMPYDVKFEMVWDIIKKMSLESIQGEVPRHLSFGQCQKVALAKALVKKPQILIFDEPLSNIDSMSKNDYKKLIVDAKKLLPECTFFYVTHNINDAMELSNKIMVLDEGKILQFDKKQLVFENPSSIKVASYLLPLCEKTYGKIEDGFFVNNELKYKLTDFQMATLDEKLCEDVSCHSIGDIHIYFDKYGNFLTGFKDGYYTNLKIEHDEICILESNYKIDKIKDVIIKYGNCMAFLNRKKMSLEYIENSIKIMGEVVFKKHDTIVLKADDLLIPFICDDDFNLHDKVLISYPIEEIKGFNDQGERTISSYVISDNNINIKILNSKKGLIKIGKQKIINKMFIGLNGNYKYKLGLDDILINKDGKFKIDVLYNEENLNTGNLIHFSSKNVGDYLSACVNEFKLFNRDKIYFDIIFSHPENLNRESKKEDPHEKEISIN